jgi:hypothetical protein
MKWLSIISNPRQEIYELWNTKEKLLTLNYHADKGTLRVTANDEKRVLLIGKEGFLRSRMVLRNEYGVRMGQLNYETQESRGRIEIYEEEFNYVTQNNFPSKVAIYRRNEMLAVCELPAVSENNDLLILTLCWYISTAIIREVNSHLVQEYA